jgi:meiotically up-regulated gene 157 (Mug157) protein
LHFKTPYDPHDQLIKSTRRFILSKDNPLFYQGEYGRGIGSPHTSTGCVWPMSIIMEGLTNNAEKNLDDVWKRLEISHVGTFVMHESFNITNPHEFSRKW